MPFFKRLEQVVRARDSLLCIGLDPAFSSEEIAAYGHSRCADLALEKNRKLIETTAEYAAAYKPNIAFYEALGEAGLAALKKTLSMVPQGIPVIIDAKRGDISNTAKAYAQAVFGDLGADAVTLSPYMGLDTLEPFLEWQDRGVFVLCRTSNPGSGFLQDIPVDGEPLYARLASACAGLGEDQIGLVVAGNDTEALMRARQAAPKLWFLSPGIGAQGGKADEAFSAGARDDGLGILVVAARSVAEAEDPGKAARELRDVLRRARDARLSSSLDTKASISQAAASQASAHKAHASGAEALESAFVQSLIDTGCFRLGEFTLKSGKKSPFYIDLRKLIADPAAMHIAGKAYAALAARCSFDRIAGIPAAGLPLATAASLEIKAPMIWPRMPVKEHGTGNRIEGSYQQGERILLLDDLITTGASKLEALDILRGEGLMVEDLVVLIERGKQGRRDMEGAGIRLHAFIHVLRLFEVLLEKGIVDGARYESLVRYVEEE